MNLLQDWVFLSVMGSIASAFYILIAEYYPKSAMSMFFWRGFGPAVALIPAALYFEWPSDPVFYVLLLFISLSASVADIRFIMAANKFGAGMVARTGPLAPFLTFILWTALHPLTLLAYWNDPVLGIGVTASICGCVYFGMRLRKCTVSKEAYLFMVPTLVTYAITSILAKYALDLVPGSNGVFLYAFLQGTIMAAAVTAYLVYKKDRERLSHFFMPMCVKVGLVIAVLVSLMMVLRNYAFLYADNISYPSAISLLTPVWLLVIYKFIKKKEGGDVLSGMGIMVCAIILVLLTADH